MSFNQLSHLGAEVSKFPGILHLKSQIQSLIKSSEKEPSGFVSAFLSTRHKPIQNDLAAGRAGWAKLEWPLPIQHVQPCVISRHTQFYKWL